MNSILPWLPAFGFCFVVFLIGLWFQKKERVRRAARTLAPDMANLENQPGARKAQPPSPLGNYTGKPQGTHQVH